jgi:hypothetical protein
VNIGWGNLKERDDLEGIDVGKNNIKMNLKAMKVPGME